jgi:hypothetical protein
MTEPQPQRPEWPERFAGDHPPVPSPNAPLEEPAPAQSLPSSAQPPAAPAPGGAPEPDPQVTARVERLRERASREFPKAWVPEQPGEELAGELDRYESGTTAYGEQTIAVLRTLDGAERAVWLIHAVLRDEFAKLQPRPGELVLIRYLGKREPAGGGSAYVSYRLEVDRPDAVPDWAAVGGEPAQISDPPPEQGVGGPDEDIPF